MMKAKIRSAAACVLVILGSAVVLGAAGSSDIGAASIGEMIVRSVIGIVLLSVGAVLGYEGEKE